MPTVLFVDDEAVARQNYKTILTHHGYAVTLASTVREAVSQLESSGEFDLLLTDMRMGSESGLDLLREAHRLRPELEVIVLTGHAEMANAIEAMKLGAADYLTKETDYKEILITIEKVLEKKQLKNEIARLRAQLREEHSFQRIVGKSQAIQQVLSIVQRVAETDSRVLITGESGTGKELIAETIHLHSQRKNGPFIAINCGAIASELQESELFGHVRGAFTGADQDKKGLIEAADKGTIFLDEVGEMSLETQVKLLRVLEKNELLPVGSTQTRMVDLRVIAATNRDLSEAIREHRFREDLYYRLKVVAVHLPPLRERKEDIPLIAAELLRELNSKTHRRIQGISHDAEEVLIEYQWPGNVRELKNVLERAMIFANSSTIEIEDLPEELFAKSVSTEAITGEEPDIISLEEAEKRYILDTLDRLHGNKLLTARHLKIATTTLYRKLRQYGIE